VKNAVNNIENYQNILDKKYIRRYLKYIFQTWSCHKNRRKKLHRIKIPVLILSQVIVSSTYRTTRRPSTSPTSRERCEPWGGPRTWCRVAGWPVRSPELRPPVVADRCRRTRRTPSTGARLPRCHQWTTRTPLAAAWRQPKKPPSPVKYVQHTRVITRVYIGRWYTSDDGRWLYCNL